MKTTIRYGALFALSIAMSTAACGGSNEQPKGPAEKAGEKVDNAGDDAAHAAAKATDKAKDGADDVKDKADEETK